jgi:hypothetical protein
MATAAQRMTRQRKPGLRKPPRSIMAVRWSGLTPTRKTAVPGQRRQRGARLLQEIAALGDEDARASLQRLRCPFTLKDKNGKVAGSICYDGDD